MTPPPFRTRRSIRSSRPAYSESQCFLTEEIIAELAGAGFVRDPDPLLTDTTGYGRGRLAQLDPRSTKGRSLAQHTLATSHRESLDDVLLHKRSI